MDDVSTLEVGRGTIRKNKSRGKLPEHSSLFQNKFPASANVADILSVVVGDKINILRGIGAVKRIKGNHTQNQITQHMCSLVLKGSSGKIHDNDASGGVIADLVDSKTEVNTLLMMMLVLNGAQNSLADKMKCP